MPQNRAVTEDSRPPLPPADFPVSPLGREGYCAAEVDPFIARLLRAMRSDPPTSSAQEVAEQRFTVKRFGRRYSLREVDDYLDLAAGLLGGPQARGAAAGSAAPGSGPRHFPTIWIYLTALLLILVVVGFAISRL